MTTDHIQLKTLDHPADTIVESVLKLQPIVILHGLTTYLQQGPKVGTMLAIPLVGQEMHVNVIPSRFGDIRFDELLSSNFVAL